MAYVSQSVMRFLSPREREIVKLLREGLDRRTIAKQLCISETTLKKHIQHIKCKSIEGAKKIFDAAK